ncbi:hypothetical protein [Arthrobacter sp. SO3]|uniref:hypothetical protein n=1 Tax=Arthrobacter sp. SO3 TaxID=1897057 RepID=UPI001CFFF3E1|nr:hypothetical protein [Arthrobacter sp. SO3]MCB5293365.1 hypothetical protein [Arthrobacter sp. SO3]
MTKTLRFSVPALLSTRGAGFGNEVIAWGKAFIGAQELGLRTLHPAWSMNQRPYRHDFGTSLLDWPAHKVLRRALPSITVDGSMASTHDDYADVMRTLAERVARKRGPLVLVHTSGMSGGYYGIRGARDFLRTAVESPAHVAGDTYRIRQRLSPEKLTVALHIRAGDFADNNGGPQPGQFNTMLPIEWYAATGENLRAAFRHNIDFVIFTDDERNPGIVSLAKELKAVPLPDRARPLLSDIQTMASADLLLCSVSSLSMFAAFISNKPYIWYGPHLGEKTGLRSIWGHEDTQAQGLTAANAAVYEQDPLVTRGTAVMQDGALTRGFHQCWAEGCV